jgi:hypothetical protein
MRIRESLFVKIVQLAVVVVNIASLQIVTVVYLNVKREIVNMEVIFIVTTKIMVNILNALGKATT